MPGVAVPRPAPGAAVDPIALEPVDELLVTTLVDNVYDALLAGDERTRRVPIDVATTAAPAFDGGRTAVGLVAEHGFAALVTVRRGGTTTTLLFDTGLSPDGMLTNADRLGVDLSTVQGVVLSHGHFDHAGGLVGLGRRFGGRRLPMVVHPYALTRRRQAVPGREPWELPTLSPRALNGEGFTVVERREPSLLVDGCVLLTGEVDRTTDFETGMQPTHQALRDGEWVPDQLVHDDQAVVVNVRDKGLVILTGCGHAGIVNIVRYAKRLTGVDRVHAVLGGLHLRGGAVVEQTIKALAAEAPGVVVPAHCTSFMAQHAMLAAMPDAFKPNAVGSRFEL